MSVSQLSDRYAKSLYSLAVDQQQVDDVNTALANLGQTIFQSADLRDFLNNPLLSEQERGKVLKALFAGKVPALLERFLFFINDKNRLNILADIIESFDALYLKAHNRVRAQIQMALPLEISVRDAIIKQLSKKYGKEVIAEWQIRKEILGGFRILIEGRLLDYSFTNQLEQYREQVLHS